MELTKVEKTGIARRFITALREADLSALRTLLTVDAAWQIPLSSPPPFGGRHEGRDKIIALLESSLPGMFKPGIGGVVIGDVLVDDDRVVAEATISGETPKGRFYENQYVFILRLRGDCISEFKEHLDTQHANDIFWS